MKKITLGLFILSSLVLISNLIFSAKITTPLVIVTVLGLSGYLLSLFKDIIQSRRLKVFELHFAEKLKNHLNDNIDNALIPFEKSFIPKNEIKKLTETESKEIQKIDNTILSLLQKSEFEQVEKILNILVKKYKFSFIRKRFGDLYLGKGEYELSIKFYKKALSQNHKNYAARENLAIAYFQLAFKNPGTNNAVHFYKKSIETNKMFFSAHYNLGIEYAKKSNSLAIQSFHNALNVNPNADKVFAAMGQYYLSIRDFENAHLSCEKAIELNPINTSAWEVQGLTFLYQNDFIEAGRMFEKVISIDPNNERAKENLNNITKIRDSSEIDLIVE